MSIKIHCRHLLSTKRSKGMNGIPCDSDQKQISYQNQSLGLVTVAIQVAPVFPLHSCFLKDKKNNLKLVFLDVSSILFNRLYSLPSISLAYVF